MSPEWMEDNVPITVRGWEEEDEALADKQEELKGFWLLSPEKRERTVRLFWVSLFLYNYFADKHFTHVWSLCVAASIGMFLADTLKCRIIRRSATLTRYVRVEVDPLGRQVS